jgi:hypothetical protein
MKFTSPFKDFSKTEFYLFGLFIVYLVIPFKTPSFLHKFFVNPIGLILLLCVAAAMFLYTPPILAIVFVLVIYELLRRDGNSDKTYHAPAYISDNTKQKYKYVSDPVIHESVESKGVIVNKPTVSEPYVEPKRDTVYLPTGDTLEEQLVSERASIDYSHGGNITESNFKPISETSIGSVFYTIAHL